METTEYLTPADVEKEFKIGRSTQRYLRQKRLIPFVSIGGGRLVRYRRFELERWLAEKSVPLASAATRERTSASHAV